MALDLVVGCKTGCSAVQAGCKTGALFRQVFSRLVVVVALWLGIILHVSEQCEC